MLVRIMIPNSQIVHSRYDPTVPIALPLHLFMSICLWWVMSLAVRSVMIIQASQGAFDKTGHIFHSKSQVVNGWI